MSDPQVHTLRPTGGRPLQFRGTEIASASSRGPHAGSSNAATRWHEITVYRTEAGRFVLSVRFFSEWQGELGLDYAEVYADPSALAEALQAFPVVPDTVGYPLGEHYAAKQARLEADLRHRFRDAVSEVLEDLPGCERWID